MIDLFTVNLCKIIVPSGDDYEDYLIDFLYLVCDLYKHTNLSILYNDKQKDILFEFLAHNYDDDHITEGKGYINLNLQI